METLLPATGVVRQPPARSARHVSLRIAPAFLVHFLARVAPMTRPVERAASTPPERPTRLLGAVAICGHEDELIYPNGTPACTVDF